MDMPFFRCLICAENFPVIVAAETAAIGFHATRFIAAATTGAAMVIALERLRQEEALEIPARLRTEDARGFFEQMVEGGPTTARPPDSGFTSFIMGS
ncbi:hypothetical protein [Stenotrophomonas pictorum]|nr:hypothetical protein [Stenotrophomonas pictorum]